MTNRSVLRGIRAAGLRDLAREAIRDGWTASVDGNTHLCLTHPNGARVRLSMTAGDSHRGVKNVRAAIRRAQREVA